MSRDHSHRTAGASRPANNFGSLNIEELISILTDGRPYSIIMPPVTVDREAAVQRLKAKPPRHFRGLLEATRDFAIGLVWAFQGPFEFARPSGRPSVILIGDDLACSTGPDGFHEESVRAALKDARFVGIVATEPLLYIYNSAATCAARDRLNAVIIETRIEHKDAWLALVQEMARDAGIAVSVPQEGM
jgi:hypothetical protein